MKVGFVCSFGMSTYLVGNLVEKAAKANNMELTMEAFPASEVETRIDEFDIILLGPQLKYKAPEIQESATRHQKKFAVIPIEVYGSMDGEVILRFILGME